MKTRFVASQVATGAQDLLMFKIEDGLPDVKAFYKKKRDWEAKTGEPRLLQVELTVHYNPRSRKQLNLAWELETRIAQKDNVTKDEVHRGTRANFYPTEQIYDGTYAIKEELTTVDETQVIQKLIVECVEKGIDIYDIWILFTHWRWGMEKDPLEGQYGGSDDYREMHPLCEACGKYLLVTGGEGIRQHTGHLAHIVSRGAGGPDKDWNWLMLCHSHHIEVQHQHGWDRLLELFPFLKPKVDRAHQLITKERTDAGQTAHSDGAPAPQPEVQQESQPEVQDPARQDPGPGPEPDDFEDDIPWEEGSDSAGHLAVGEHQGRPEATPPVQEDAPRESQAEMVTRIFRGTVVEGADQVRPAEATPPGVDPEKDKMMAKLRGMEQKAEERRKKYYGKEESEADGQQSLLDEKPEPADVKKAQYKDDDEKDGELPIF